MTASWTLLSVKAVADGSLLAFTWEVTAPSSEIGEDPNWASGPSRQKEPTLYDTIRFRASNQFLDFGYVASVSGALADWRRPAGSGTVTAQFTFLLSVLHEPVEPPRVPRDVAINSQAYMSGPTVDVAVDDVRVSFHDTGIDPLEGPTSAIEGFPIDTSEIGMLPGGGDLKLFVDAHAESVANGLGAVDPLEKWSNLAAGGFLEAASDKEPSLTTGDGAKPRVEFDASNTEHMAMPSANVPAITTTATIAAVFIPNSSNAVQHIIGRWGETGDEAWRFHYDGSGEVGKIVYQTKSGDGIDAITYELDPLDETVFFVFRRQWNGMQTIHEMWINGRLTEGTGDIADDPEEGDGDLTIGARHNGSSWIEAFNGQINQAAIYDTFVNDAQLSLILHTMGLRAGFSTGDVRLGMPFPDQYRVQPYPDSNEDENAPKPGLGRKPIAVISLFTGSQSNNPYGQSRDWRSANAPRIERVLTEEIRYAINACDDFEIMFRLPGGNYPGGQIFHSNVFTSGMNRGIAGDQPMITTTMWTAMKNVWLALNLGEKSETVGRGVPTQRPRRGWFYTGSGFAMLADAQPTPNGHMEMRNVGPVSGEVYHEELMEMWADQDPDATHRFRCFMLDQSGAWRGLLSPLCHSEFMQEEGFIFVGEAIAGGIDEARLGAPWYGVLDYDRAPWWIRNDDEPPNNPYHRANGYNTQWTGDWTTMPVYFEVRADGPAGQMPPQRYPYLYRPLTTGPTDPGDGQNMKLSDIYRFILKGGTPVAGNQQVMRKVGAAWNYATGRLPLNRWDRWGRVVRFQR